MDSLTITLKPLTHSKPPWSLNYGLHIGFESLTLRIGAFLDRDEFHIIGVVPPLPVRVGAAEPALVDVLTWLLAGDTVHFRPPPGAVRTTGLQRTVNARTPLQST